MTHEDDTWSSLALHVAGGWTREGYVLIDAERAGFVPTSDWKHIAVEIGLGLLTTEVTFGQTEVVTDDPAGQVERHEGFFLDDSWSWSRPRRGLLQAGTGEYVELKTEAPESRASRWTVLARDPAAQEAVRRRIMLGATAVVAVLVGAGVVAWRLTGNDEFLTAGVCFAALIGGSAVAGVILGTRAADSEDLREDRE